MNHIMVDLETLGTLPDSVILSIGAVAFDPQTGKLGDEFYTPISKSSCVEAGMRIMPSTLAWWEQQSSGARMALRDAETTGTTLKAALLKFAAWVESQGDDMQVWGNGASFDNAMLQLAYGQLGLDLPWKFYNDRCYRTLKNIYPHVMLSYRVGTYHNALDDAKTQALHAIDLLREQENRQRQFQRIREWAEDRNLIAGATSQSQMVKLVEELGELAGALARGKRDGVIDGIGDAVVVLTILAAQQSLRIEDCIYSAWTEIKDRKGRMVDGIFVKEE